MSGFGPQKQGLVTFEVTISTPVMLQPSVFDPHNFYPETVSRLVMSIEELYTAMIFTIY